MADHVRVPVKMFKGSRWGDLNSMAISHEFVAETYHIDQQFSFEGGHRVRRFKVKKNVHWLIPVGVDLDIAGVTDKPSRKHTNGRR